MKNRWKFILTSLVGLIFFLVPVPIGGEFKILISHFTDFVTGQLTMPLLSFTAIVMWIVLIMMVICLFWKPKNTLLHDLFVSTPIDTTLRILGAFLYLAVYYGWFDETAIGPYIAAPETGGTLVGAEGLLTTLFVTFFIGLTVMPLLTDFGLIEFVGNYFNSVMETLFRVPGYSMIDALTSFVGDGTIGLMFTDRQYQRGYYTKREAYIIATGFSVVGIAFAAAVAEQLGFGAIFPLFYLAIIVVCMIIAMVTARLPLKKYPDTYYEGKPAEAIQDKKQNMSFDEAMHEAEKVAGERTILGALGKGFRNVLGVYTGLIPIIMLVGTAALMIEEFTPLLNILGYPFQLLYQLIGFGEETAALMGPASLAGFFDQYLPVVLIANSESAAARFFIGVLSFSQVVFLSETGTVFLKTKLDMNFWDVLKLFLGRTLVSLPILAAFAFGLSALGLIG